MQKMFCSVLLGIFDLLILTLKVETAYLQGADPAAGNGVGENCWPITGVPGGWPPGGVCKGAELHCVGKFCISELKSRDLVHTFCQHYIENLLIYFQWKRYSFFFFFIMILWAYMKMGLYPAHASPSSSPSYSPFRSTYNYFLQVRLRGYCTPARKLACFANFLLHRYEN